MITHPPLTEFTLLSINSYIATTNLLKPSETVTDLSIPGEGNMNLVLRLHATENRTFIFKKSFDYVKKYPQVSAPINRDNIEASFYSIIEPVGEIKKIVPNLLFHDENNHVLIFEDLGESKDYSFLYELSYMLKEDEFNELTHFLSLLHNIPKSKANELVNTEMKKLNYEHIFSFPFNANNGFDLNTVQDGLAAIAKPYQEDETLKQTILKVGEKYLETGNVLLHGDFYPGSWLKTENGIKIIDAEFAFHGCAEFDLAVLMAHCKMAKQDIGLLEKSLLNYKGVESLNRTLLNQFVGIEIFRRLIGLAQLPLNISLKEKQQLLKEAYTLVM